MNGDFWSLVPFIDTLPLIHQVRLNLSKGGELMFARNGRSRNWPLRWVFWFILFVGVALLGWFFALRLG